MHFIRGEYLSGILKKIFLIQNMRNMTHPFFHDASILVSVGVFLTHRFETVGVFAHFLCVQNAKTPSIMSSDPDLDLWDCLGRKKTLSYNRRNTVI